MRLHAAASWTWKTYHQSAAQMAHIWMVKSRQSSCQCRNFSAMHARQVQCTKIALCELWHFVQDSGIPGAPPGITLCLDSDFGNPGQMDNFNIFYQKKIFRWNVETEGEYKTFNSPILNNFICWGWSKVKCNGRLHVMVLEKEKYSLHTSEREEIAQ